jgi:hypothetical protein
MWRPVLDRLARLARPRRLVLAGLAVAMAVSACDYEADLLAYFGTAAPSVAPSASVPPLVTATPTEVASPSASASVLPSATPSAPVSPSASPSASTDPLPTRPPGLAEWTTLRERARIVDYAKLLARPADFVDELVYFEGHVASVSEDGSGHFRARIRSGGQFMYWLYDAATYWGQPLVQGDRVRVVGYFIGLSSEAETGERVPEIEVLEILVKFT